MAPHACAPAGCDPTVADVTLADLEVAAAYLGSVSGAFQKKNWETCDDFGRRVAEAVRSGHRVRVIGEGAGDMPSEDLWTLTLAETPEPWRSRTTRAFRVLAARYGFPFRPDEIVYLT